MDNDYLAQLRQKRDDKKRKDEDKKKQQEQLSAVKDSGSAIVEAVKSAAPKTDNLAKTEDVQSVVESINRLNVTTFLASKDNWTSVVSSMAEAAERIQNVIDGLETSGIKKIEKSFSDAVSSLQGVVQQVKSVKVETDGDVKAALENLAVSIEGLEVSPNITVPEPKVVVNEREVDFNPLIGLLKQLSGDILSLKDNQPSLDTSEITSGLDNVEQAIRELIARPIPVPESPLPFKTSEGKGAQALVDGDGHQQIDIVSMPGFVVDDYNYISVAYPTSTTEVYTYKDGGSSGSTVATVTVTYTSAAKTDLSSVSRT